MNKAELRRSLLQTRRQLSPEVWQAQSAQICAHLQTSSQFQQAKTILAYFSFRQEVDLSSLFRLNKVWGFPRCVEQSLSWHQCLPTDAASLRTGKYGILEPLPDAPVLSPEAVDLILVPCVACDDRGYRLGYGGGFYDRLLTSPEWQRIPTIGITFAFAHLSQLPIDAWDQPLHAICTEHRLWQISPIRAF
ncbi:MAG: 5-formyltetrahydrofolate cyclo-ligase [Scytolyngbya sp. HA4215-MV1]|jgi:5-formyltetrahydrofolate cyclo-ligase|nr:5-formyltetrahydrofolate cyclo-ligase [Scytolyngbya sp. HA4215-MV1]